MLDWLNGWVEGVGFATKIASNHMKDTTSNIWPALINGIAVLLSALITGAVAIVGVKTGAKANQAATLAAAGKIAEVDRRRFINERTWEERRRAYSLILTSLDEAGSFWSYLNDGFSEAGGSPEGFYRSKTYDDWRNEALEHWWAAKKVFSENRLILSDTFVQRFAQLREHVAANDDDHDPPGETSTMKTALRSAFADLLKISQAEISANSG